MTLYLGNNELSQKIMLNGVQMPLMNDETSGIMLSNDGSKPYWTYGQITNCLTKIPQDIKLELNNGILTLKAGSKVYKGDGSYINISNDINYDYSGSNKQYMIFTKNNIIYAREANYCYSGDTAPTGLSGDNDKFWYDTANKNVKRSTDNGTSWEEDFSLPLGLITVTSGVGTTSIDQVFNGFGYIGSTVFALPGVEGLIPDGRNSDGSLNNIKGTVTNVIIYTIAGYGYIYLRGNTSGIYTGFEGPSLDVYYDSNKNEIRFNNLAKLWTEVISVSYNNRITSFSSKQPVNLIDRSDSSWIAQQAMPSSKYIDLELGASGSTYTAPANGYILFQRRATANNQLVGITSRDNDGQALIASRLFSTETNQYLVINLPLIKGVKFEVTYTSDSTVGQFFRFVYAEGEI